MKQLTWFFDTYSPLKLPRVRHTNAQTVFATFHKTPRGCPAVIPRCSDIS